MPSLAVGVDIGGTKIAAALVSNAGEVFDFRVVPTPSKEGGPRVLETATRLAAELVHSGHVPSGGRFLGVGVGTAGQVDPALGVVVGATDTIARWVGARVKAEFERSTGLPAYVENDAKAAARAEVHLGAARRSKTALFLTLGTGVGGALALNGRIVEGACGLAGYLGHIRANLPDSGHVPVCSCGRRGCLEAYVSGTAIRAAGIRALQQSDQNRDAESAVPNASAVWEAYLSGQAWAEGVIDQARRAIVSVLSGLVHAFNPDTIVIGGGLSSWGERWCGEIAEALARNVDPLFCKDLSVVPAALGSRAGMIGAALLAVDSVKG